MRQIFPTFSRLGVCFTICLVLLFGMVFTPTMLHAQTKATITGRVVDASSGNYLPGANVMLKGTTLGAATDREGVFRIMNVQPGTYTLWVNYIGYEDYTTEVKVTGTQRVVVQDVSLKISAVEVEAVVVEGLREGQMKALSQQRSAPNIKNVVSQELIERFPDENPADVLQRVPGVFIDKSLGDGRYVLIRGTEPRLNLVMLNGQRVATNRRREREPQLDIIGSSQLASLEVIKAVTPDMDGDAIGGTVNMVTRSAFDYQSNRLDVTLGGGTAELEGLRGKMVGQGKLSYSALLGANKNIGLTFTANWDQKRRGTDRIEPEWDNEEAVTGETIPFALSQLDMRNYANEFKRYGFGGGFEYKLNDSHRWYVRGIYSRLNDDQWRGRVRLRVNKGDYLNTEGTLTSKSRIVRELDYRLEELVQKNAAFGGVNKFGNVDLDYSFAYTWASEEHIPQTESSFELDEKVNLQLDLSDTDAPKWDLVTLGNDYQYDPDHYEFDGMDYREQYSADKVVSGQVNLKVPISIAGKPTDLKFGGKLNRDTKEQDDVRKGYKWEAEDWTLKRILWDFQDTEFMNGNYNYGPMPSADKLWALFNAHKNDGSWSSETDWWSSLGENYVGHDNVYAYYAMATMNIGKLMLLGGFRHEFTSTEYTGNKALLDEDGNLTSSEKVTVTRDYNNFLPGLHLRYSLTPMTNLRLAWTNGLARPPFQAYAPYFFIDPDHERIRAGNPDLSPTTSSNFDLMFEQYFRGIGILSGGLFYKNLKDIIYESTLKVEGGVWDGYDQETTINGGDASLYGFEVAVHHELSFLPGILNGLGLFANYTHTWSDADLLGREGFLPGQAGDVGNASLSYEKHGLSLRLSANYHAKYLDAVGKDEDRDEFIDGRMQLDFSGTYEITPWMSAYLDWININDAPFVNYMGVRERPIEITYVGWWMKGGLKFRF